MSKTANVVQSLSKITLRKAICQCLCINMQRNGAKEHASYDLQKMTGCVYVSSTKYLYMDVYS